jgi:hypothetical protein
MKIIMCVILLMPSLVFGQANSNSNQQLINWFVGADIVGTSGNTKAELESDYYVREFEISAFSTIDQTFDGVMTLAYHKELEGNEEHLEVHEGFIFSSKLFPMTNIKLGKFFMGFGRLNRFHRHDWVFTDAPFVQKAFFGNEGAKDTGFEYKRLFPEHNYSLTLGVTSGNAFNHTAEPHDHGEDAEEEPHIAKSPTSYLRIARFWEYTTTQGLEIALNYIHRNDADSIVYNYSGLDLVYKNRLGRMVETLIQMEAWSREQKHDEEVHRDLGTYLYLEKGLDQHHSWGVRADYFKAASVEENDTEHTSSIDGIEVDKELKVMSLAYIYTNSEFMRTRLTLEHGQGIHIEESDVDSYTRAHFQLVFSIGAHPAHVY